MFDVNSLASSARKLEVRGDIYLYKIIYGRAMRGLGDGIVVLRDF